MRLFVACQHLCIIGNRRNLKCGVGLFKAYFFHMQQDLSNPLISYLQVWIRNHTYSILASGERSISLALCYGQGHPKCIAYSPID
jgi:hypothetical protein